MRRTLKISLSKSLALLVLVLMGCNPYQFTMGTTHFVHCEVMTSLKSVDIGNNYVTMHDTGAVDMSYFGATQYLFSVNAKLLSGQGFRILLRPVAELRSVIDSGIILNITRSGVTLDSGQHTFVSRPDVKLQPNVVLPITLLSDDHFMQVVVGCDTVYKGWSPKKESDDLYFQALEKSDVQIIAPDWAGVPE